MNFQVSALRPVTDTFEENFSKRGEIGASLSIWHRGEEILSEAAGWCDREQNRPWTSRTLIPVYSATKVPSSACVLLALQQKGLTVESAVKEVWAGFPVAGASFGDLLSHQCGLAALDQPSSIWEHESVVAAIEAQEPAWRPGEGHGYHPRTFGALVEQSVRLLTGMPLGEFWRANFSAPLDLDFWIGLPESEHGRVGRLYPGKATPEDLNSGFYREFNTVGSMTQRAFGSPRGLRSVQEMNDPKAWGAALPALGGIGTASGLAKFYQVLLGHIEGPLEPAMLGALATRSVQGDDRVLMKPTAFGAGTQFDPLDAAGKKTRTLYGPVPASFGHPGAGGSHGFADPVNGLSFGYVMNQMELSVMPGKRCTALIDALYSEKQSLSRQ